MIICMFCNRKDNKVKKTSGYHIDLLVVGLLGFVSSIFGFPWLVAAHIRTESHIKSLFLFEKQKDRHGIKKEVHVGVVDQRISGLITALFVGLTVFATPAIKFIPQSALYGIILFMGLSSLAGTELFDRVLLMFVLSKNFPHVAFARIRPLRKLHMFTGVQLFCVAVLFGVEFTPAALTFPIIVLLLVPLRHVLQYFYTEKELSQLDNHHHLRRTVDEKFADGYDVSPLAM